MEYGEFEAFLTALQNSTAEKTPKQVEADIKKAVGHAMTKYHQNHTGPRDSSEEVLSEVFGRIAQETNQAKGQGKGGAEPHFGLVEEWRKRGEGSFRLAKAAYFWLHVAPADKTYAQNIDYRLLGCLFHEHPLTRGRTVSGEPPPLPPPSAEAPTLNEVRGSPDASSRLADIQLAIPNAATFFPQTAGSGFEFHNLIAAANEEIFICGQNLFGLVKQNGGENTLAQIAAAAERGIAVRIMICNPDKKDHIKPWAFAVNAPDYGTHLRKAARIFAKWPDRIPDDRLEIRAVEFVPTSITFVDPYRLESRFALMTPHHYVPVRTDRPQILLTHHATRRLYDQYFLNYQYVWDHGVDIRKVQRGFHARIGRAFRELLGTSD